MSTTSSVTEKLCLACGLCCDGTLFKDVELQPGDEAVKLAALGLPLQPLGKNRRPEIHNLKFPQPCAALDGCCCRLYADRPLRCRQFECALLKATLAGEIEVTSALRTIGIARQRADKVRRLLSALGDANEHLALSLRFQRMKKRLEAGVTDEETADTFAQLSLAVHDLNLLLRDAFYP